MRFSLGLRSGLIFDGNGSLFIYWKVRRESIIFMGLEEGFKLLQGQFGFEGGDWVLEEEEISVGFDLFKGNFFFLLVAEAYFVFYLLQLMGISLL